MYRAIIQDQRLRQRRKSAKLKNYVSITDTSLFLTYLVCPI